MKIHTRGFLKSIAYLQKSISVGSLSPTHNNPHSSNTGIIMQQNDRPEFRPVVLLHYDA
jgi:hypothetical protein